jgi:hypothetical protein
MAAPLSVIARDTQESQLAGKPRFPLTGGFG